jgi:hypothetical protein
MEGLRSARGNANGLRGVRGGVILRTKDIRNLQILPRRLQFHRALEQNAGLDHPALPRLW